MKNKKSAIQIQFILIISFLLLIVLLFTNLNKSNTVSTYEDKTITEEINQKEETQFIEIKNSN